MRFMPSILADWQRQSSVDIVSLLRALGHVTVDQLH